MNLKTVWNVLINKIFTISLKWKLFKLTSKKSIFCTIKFCFFFSSETFSFTFDVVWHFCIILLYDVIRAYRSIFDIDLRTFFHTCRYPATLISCRSNVLQHIFFKVQNPSYKSRTVKDWDHRLDLLLSIILSKNKFKIPHILMRWRSHTAKMQPKNGYKSLQQLICGLKDKTMGGRKNLPRIR